MDELLGDPTTGRLPKSAKSCWAPASIQYGISRIRVRSEEMVLTRIGERVIAGRPRVVGDGGCVATEILKRKRQCGAVK